MSGGGKGAIMGDFVREAREEFERERAADEQTEMFAAPTRLRGAAGLAVDLAVREHNGPGRRAGIGNKSTEEFRRFLHGKGVSPLVQMMRWSLMTPTLLAAELGCTRLEAFQQLKSLWIELAPYMHQRQALAIEAQGATAGILLLGVMTATQRDEIVRDFGPEALQLVDQGSQQKQGVTIDAEPLSHDAKSHEVKDA